MRSISLQKIFLLYSRKQFPSVSNSPVVPQSIPAWQLASVPQDGEQDPKSEELIEIGSGSTSSEPEQGAKNSDSSLEIMWISIYRNIIEVFLPKNSDIFLIRGVDL